MQDAIWHYTDIAGAQHGPVTADVVLEGLRTGTIGAGSEFWREGLPGWVPLEAVSTELGVGGMPPPDPYTAPVASVVPGPAAAGEVVPAGFVRRWAALFIDQLILVVPLIILAGVLGAAMSMSSDPSPAFLLLFYGGYFLVAGLYYAGQESSRHQATLGKRALGIKVTDTDGRRLGFAQALGRWAAAAVSYLTFYIGFLMAAFTERKRALHDMMAGTLVVDRWAYTDHPEKQKRELSGCLIAALVALLAGPALVGIIAAISIPQYQGYVARAQVSEASSLAYGVKTAVTEYYVGNQAFPASNADAGLAAPEEITGMYVRRFTVHPDGSIEAEFSAQAPQKAHAAIDGATLVYTPRVEGEGLVWDCHSATIEQKYCPGSCACQ